eukprot:CAMPEP_0183294822 /NCGR_PEP_ID=MMETSP0160_2-20130417/2994_1 /TAXON_ID=2839 ORGANISM="Odontella Sinensis, Strain Grunow 1884" /NCGR_SAMPLE_ID=MMETSP0160_2 /ASSEMBLY_ACC=CAM_ASM_000250 /LENGTH=453 /DNA_ID=CAMNT_0025456191 /DNA_START=104 /DNA_END=1465 /DNA_ORIENTATION=+
MSVSLLNSVFGVSRWSSRLEDMRTAESSLVRLAQRFGSGRSQDGGGGAGTILEVFDTAIPRSAVPSLREGSERCQVGITAASKRTRAEGKDDEEGTTLTVHGVRVVSESDRSSSSAAPLVLLHGYANGALYFYRNLLGLAEDHFGTVYALDMLGWGLSSRPTFRTSEDTVESAEDFFVESLEAWREANKLEKITLGGHSMGGYVSVAYTEKYPERVEELILLSPAGVPNSKPDPKLRQNLPMSYRFMFTLAEQLWERGITPGSFLRSLPESRGRAMVQRYVEGRLPAITCPEEQSVLAEYLYTNSILPGSGEFSLNRLLNPMAYAKSPTVYRIPDLKVGKISFVYGQNDWMDPSGGMEVMRLVEERRKSGDKTVPKVEVYGVRNAGHLLMLENWEGFNAAVMAAVRGGGKIGAGAAKMRNDKDGENFFRRPKFGRRGGDNKVQQDVDTSVQSS